MLQSISGLKVKNQVTWLFPDDLSLQRLSVLRVKDCTAIGSRVKRVVLPFPDDLTLQSIYSVRNGRDLLDSSTSIQIEYIIAQMMMPSTRSQSQSIHCLPQGSH